MLALVPYPTSGPRRKLDVPMRDHIDLRPLLADPTAATMLLLARGQLNRAFRAHGLVPPDPLVVEDDSGVDPAELDDPASTGIDSALAKFQEPFMAWASQMPASLVPPVLDILQQANRALCQQQGDSGAAGVAARNAYGFLLGCLPPPTDSAPHTPSRLHVPE